MLIFRLIINFSQIPLNKMYIFILRLRYLSHVNHVTTIIKFYKFCTQKFVCTEVEYYKT